MSMSVSMAQPMKNKTVCEFCERVPSFKAARLPDWIAVAEPCFKNLIPDDPLLTYAAVHE